MKVSEWIKKNTGNTIAIPPDWELDNILYPQLDRDIEDMPVIDDKGILLGTVNMTAALKEMRKENTE